MKWGGDLPSFALLSSPSRECFTLLSYIIQMSVLSDLILKIEVLDMLGVIRVVDDGLCWMITPSSYHPRNQFRTCFNYHSHSTL
jgi:hypothetical protein